MEPASPEGVEAPQGGEGVVAGDEGGVLQQRLGGERARFIFNPGARFDLARRLHEGEDVMMGEVFTFVSGLYFRGKLAYAIHPWYGAVGTKLK